jgi:hypothetical protein
MTVSVHPFSFLSVPLFIRRVTGFSLSVNDVIFLIHAISGLSGIIPLAIGIKKFRRLQPALKLLVLNLFIGLIVEILAWLLTRTKTPILPNNYYIYGLYTPIEFILFVLIFKNWHEGKKMLRFLTWSIPLFLVLWGGIYIWWSATGSPTEKLLDIDDILLSTQCVFFTVISIVTLLDIIKEDSTPVLSSPIFWVTSAVLIYFSGNLFVFTFRYIIVRSDNLIVYWYLHTTLNFLKNIFFAVGFLSAGKMLLPTRRSVEVENG